MTSEAGQLCLLVRTGEQRCAFALEHVVETMRPLPTTPFPNAPPFVRGIAVIRGAPVPVIDAGSLLQARSSDEPRRFVTLRTGARTVALAVDEVTGIFPVPTKTQWELPPLLAAGADLSVTAIAIHDAELLTVLQSAHLIPESVWEAVANHGR